MVVARRPLYWTESEFRRLGNEAERVVKSEGVTRDGSGSFRQRAKLVSAVDEMKTRFARLEEAVNQLEVSGGKWEGLRGTESDPRAVLEAYEARLESLEAFIEDAGLGDLREERVAAEKERAMEEAVSKKNQEESARAATAVAAVATANNRDALLRRRKPKQSSANQESILEQHRPVHEQMTAELVDMVGALKKNFQDMNGQIERDNAVLDETDAAVDQNLDKVQQQNKSLGEYVRSSTRTTWTTYILVLFSVLVTLIMILFILAIRHM